MMKHLFSFLIIVSLLLFGCRSKTQSNFQPELSEQAEESYSLPEEYAEEVIVTGKVLNRDFYPNEKDLTLIIPFFRKMENQYCAPIRIVHTVPDLYLDLSTYVVHYYTNH